MSSTPPQASDPSAAPPGGLKFDAGKLPLHLLPLDAIEEVAKVLAFGAQKYKARNWEQGMAYSRLFAAALRHLFDWWRGKEEDPETQLSHLAHAMCCVMFLLSYRLRTRSGDLDAGGQLDDRP